MTLILINLYLGNNYFILFVSSSIDSIEMSDDRK